LPALTIQIQAGGPLLDLEVGVSAPRRQALQAASQPIPASVKIRVLVDTGASNTCIDKNIIQALQLTPTGTMPIHTPSTGNAPHQCNQYDVHLTIIHPRLSFAIPALPIIESDFSQQGIQGLLGRDVLAGCVLVYNGEVGFYTLAF